MIGNIGIADNSRVLGKTFGYNGISSKTEKEEKTFEKQLAILNERLKNASTPRKKYNVEQEISRLKQKHEAKKAKRRYNGKRLSTLEIIRKETPNISPINYSWDPAESFLPWPFQD